MLLQFPNSPEIASRGSSASAPPRLLYIWYGERVLGMLPVTIPLPLIRHWLLRTARADQDPYLLVFRNSTIILLLALSCWTRLTSCTMVSLFPNPSWGVTGRSNIEYDCSPHIKPLSTPAYGIAWVAIARRFMLTRAFAM